MAGEADNVFALTTVYATKAQAMRAAQAKWDKLQRGVAEFSISLATGRADIYTETPVKVSGFTPQLRGFIYGRCGRYVDSG